MFVRKVQIETAKGAPVDLGYVAHLPVFRALSRSPLAFSKPVTILVGNNGAGKSTLLEALAVAMRFHPDGGFLGARKFSETGTQTHSALHELLRVSRSENPRAGYFFRAETHYNQITKMDRSPTYAGAHRHSHGETVLNVLEEAFKERGLFIFDEPEAGLSPVSQMAVMGMIALAARDGSQFIVATHSPIIAGIPGANIVAVEEEGIVPTDYEDTEIVQATREFLADPIGSADIIIEGL